MALPLPVLYNLRINSQQKMGLVVIFCLGLITIIFAIVRVIETNATKTHVDPIWLALWSMIECAVAVIVACLPSLKALIRTGGTSKNYNSRGLSNTTANKKGAIRLRPLTDTTGSSRFVTAAQGTSTSEEHIVDKGGIHVSQEFVSHP